MRQGNKRKPKYLPLLNGKLFNITSPYVAPSVEKFKRDKYGPILYEDANVCPGKRNYHRYLRADKKKKERRGPTEPEKRTPGPWIVAIKLPFYQKLTKIKKKK